VIGRTLHLNSFAFTIIGVLPQQMDFPSRADVWTPTIFDNHTFLREGGAFMPSAIVRLRRGASVEQALAELNARALSVRHGKVRAEDERPQLKGIAAELTRSIRSSLYMLSGAVAFVLLIACANLASLMLVRTAERSTALAVRAALGATRSRLMQQQLVESVLIALFGAMIGILFAHGALRVLYLFRPAALAQFSRPAIESGVLAFTMALSILTGLLFGMMPAWIAAHQSPETVLKAGAWRTNPTRNRLRQFLVIFEIALSLVLLVGTGLLLRTIYSLNHVPLGFDVQHRLSFTVSLHGAPYDFTNSPAGQKSASSIAAIEHDPSTRSMDSFYTRALGRLSRLPGVMHVAMINDLPLNIGADMLFPIHNAVADVSAAPRVASSGYFKTMGIRLLEGRDFSAQDTGDSGRVVIVTKNLADKLWPGKDAIGQQLQCAWFCDPSATVIGVVAPAHVYGPRPDAQQEFYLSYSQVRWPSATFVLQTQSNPNGLIQEVRHAIAEIDPRQPVYNTESMQERLEDKESLERFQVFALSVFAGISIAMAIVGLYGVISYSVAQRTREIGLRMALGAPEAQIVRAFLREGMLLLAAGCAMGGVAGFYLSRLLSATLYGVRPGDPWTFLAVTILFWLTATLASWVPARRAAAVDPIRALRTE
jgi:putative ABC transport system permease protein